MVLQEYERGEFIKVHTAEIKQDPGGQNIKEHIAKIEQDANKVERAIMISAKITADQKWVAKGLIDPGGGANTYMYAGEGKIFYPEIKEGGKGAIMIGTEEKSGARGLIKDPGGGEDIEIGWHPNFEKYVDTVVTHEVQELKHHRSIKEEAEEIRNETQMNKGHRKMYQEEIQMELDLRGSDGTGPKGDPSGTGFIEKENRKEELKKKKWAEANNMDNYEMCGKIRVA